MKLTRFWKLTKNNFLRKMVHSNLEKNGQCEMMG